MSTKTKIILLCAGLMSSPAWSLPSYSDSPCGPESVLRTTNACMPVVFVIRHAEDTSSGPHALTPEGEKHAELYIQLFDKYIWGSPHSVGVDKSQACVCPIGKIISISKKGGDVQPHNPNPSPSPNPYNTIKKVSEYLNIPITTDNGETQYWATFQWGADAKKKLFDYQGNASEYSVVISWDKQGLNPTEEDYYKQLAWLKPPESNLPFKDFTPLLKYFPKTIPTIPSFSEPLRTNLWVYSDQNEEGKFNNLRFYEQIFYNKDCKTGATLTPTLKSECLIAVQRDN